MDLLLEENCPETCAMVGLDCGTCIHKTAASVARICHGLESSNIQQVFLQLYPSAACRPMAHAFELAYRESFTVARPVRAAIAAA